MDATQFARSIHYTVDHARAQLNECIAMTRRKNVDLHIVRLKMADALGKLDFVVGELEKVDY